ncbi:Pre-mRNA-splicing factor 18 [Nymphon striatum]|nr:Pre-mRNA-splicing factor 18 [Nymphon striatum]
MICRKGPNIKCFKRGDLTKKMDEIYLKKKAASQKQEVIVKAAHLKNAYDDVNEDGILLRKEVIKRLRERNEPILLFGESELDAFKRLRRLEIIEPEVNRGFRNDFQEAMEKVDQAYLSEIIKSQQEDGKDKTTSANDVKIPESNTTIEEIEVNITLRIVIVELDILVKTIKLAETLGIGDNSQDQKAILAYLKFLLEVWGKYLNSRPNEEKASMIGKVANATFSQTQTYLKPLLRKLKKKLLPEDILIHLVVIVKYMLDKEYIKASDAYLQMAIGNAPWPIGVTMVGIHARTGREKIYAQHVAHVLNDETQRKYIQGLKRLMTQCQRMFPTVPSKSVEYNA